MRLHVPRGSRSRIRPARSPVIGALEGRTLPSLTLTCVSVTASSSALTYGQVEPLTATVAAAPGPSVPNSQSLCHDSQKGA